MSTDSGKIRVVIQLMYASSTRRMIYGILKDVEYQNILGMNVLTMKI